MLSVSHRAKTQTIQQDNVAALPRLSRQQAEQLLLQHIALLDQLTTFAARRHGILPSEREDADGWIKLRLVENNYSILRKFRGGSQFSTYLTTVVLNLARDYRIRYWGRWRLSGQARHIGGAAVLLDCLCNRDGHSLDEAIEMLRSNYGITASRESLCELALELPQRQLRPRFEDIEAHVLVAREVNRKPLRYNQRRAELSRHLESVLRDLSHEDRLLLRLHYGHGVTIATLARTFSKPQRSLYSRRNRILRYLRKKLESIGTRWAEIQDIIEWGEIELEVLTG